MKFELWAGIECTVARIGDGYRDELLLTGHHERIEDLDLLASLGVSAVRYPVLWEREAAHAEWCDERLARLRSLGIRPIVGLVHHGSGPRHTSLLDGSFVTGVRDFASRVAQRYPWVRDYTPINEPLTTARFSALYGHWYPHARDDASFVRALVNECAAVREAMRAIRAVTPGARLIQTEDLGKTFSTPRLAYQCEFDEARRWLSLDLLCGRVGKDHPLRWYVEKFGITPAELDEFAERPCPPDVVGINYYITSDRFLDEDLARYPASAHGGNHIERYADFEAVRAREEGILGHRALLQEVWERYRLPVAFTEVHMGSTREEQGRWLLEAWRAVEDAERDGIDVRAITPWATFGSVDWDCLLTSDRGHYEPGLYDVRAAASCSGAGPPMAPRPTALEGLVRELTRTGTTTHPAFADPGWWRRDDRFVDGRHPTCAVTSSSPPIVVTGASGALGRRITRALEERGLPYCAFDRATLDVTSARDVRAVLQRLRPWAVVNAAGVADPIAAERDPERCQHTNVLGPSTLARACADACVRLVTFSSPLVFDGRSRQPYTESADVSPLGVYGLSQALAERAVCAVLPEALVVRAGTFFDVDTGFIARSVRALAEGHRVVMHHDRTLSVGYLPDVVRAVLDLLVDGASGIWHVTNAGALSPYELVRRAAEASGVGTHTLDAIPCSDHLAPKYAVLGSERMHLLADIDDALERYARVA